jgi:transposase-like protein
MPVNAGRKELSMKEITRERKNANRFFTRFGRGEWLKERMVNIITHGKRAFDECAMEVGRMLAETFLYMEREEMAGPDYHPLDSSVKKWASQPGSVFIGGHKVRVERPRLRGPQGEMRLRSYTMLQNPAQFSEEILSKALRGLSGRKYRETVLETAGFFGISPSSVSRHLVRATARKIQGLLERDLSSIDLFAVFLDTIHRGGVAFVVALGLDRRGKKWSLGFWEGATENHAVCQALLSDLESRGLKLGPDVLFVTDGGGGILKCLRERYGKRLIHQRCTIHKDRNIQDHLPKRYRQEAHRRYRRALELTRYSEAKAELMNFEKWLREINESAADSLLEALEEILTLHRLQVPKLLRKGLHSTNPIEAMFSQVRRAERNILRYRGSKMSRRWLGTCLLHAEAQFRRVRGYGSIAEVVKNIEREHQEETARKAA